MSFSFLCIFGSHLYSSGNERLQEMMGIMASERGGSVFATDERYKIIYIGKFDSWLTPLIIDSASTTAS